MWTAVFTLLVGCERPSSVVTPVVVAAVSSPTVTPTAIATPTLAATPTATRLVLPSPSPATFLTATPFFQGTPSTPCGQTLPLLPTTANLDSPAQSLTPDPALLDAVQTQLPDSAVPALQRILSHPQTVGLVAYRLGDEANGVYLNADTPMPLASVVKMIHLVAYAEAVTAGEINPLTTVALQTLDDYHIPNFDLGAHRRAVIELEENGRIFGTPPSIILEDVVWMMIRHSSNAATDYLHRLLGQQRIEETAVSLGLTSQTAPCPFLGQFLAMGNHTRQAASDRAAITAYLENPAAYGAEVTLLTDAFLADASFREAEIEWRRETERPSINNQWFFAANLNPQATPRDYATLMARIAQNGLSNPESSFLARRYLEWPMVFADNQELFSNLGYKNGTLPGVLTTAYYAYPLGEVTPVVVILFFRDLPNSTYREWRQTLPHDEFARWLLVNTAVFPTLNHLFINS